MIEYEIAAMERLKCRMLGSEQQFVLMESAPPGSLIPLYSIHAMNRKLGSGDQVGILIAATDPAGYYTHRFRIVCIGKISEELEMVFDLAKEAQKLTLEMIRLTLTVSI